MGISKACRFSHSEMAPNCDQICASRSLSLYLFDFRCYWVHRVCVCIARRGQKIPSTEYLLVRTIESVIKMFIEEFYFVSTTMIYGVSCTIQSEMVSFFIVSPDINTLTPTCVIISSIDNTVMSESSHVFITTPMTTHIHCVRSRWDISKRLSDVETTTTKISKNINVIYFTDDSNRFVTFIMIHELYIILYSFAFGWHSCTRNVQIRNWLIEMKTKWKIIQRNGARFRGTSFFVYPPFSRHLFYLINTWAGEHIGDTLYVYGDMIQILCVCGVCYQSQ